ncbi:hypothetical protein BTE48_16410 [Oceanospirillum multiglobuliferum]|uniref:Uncharacterized protein n=1 Tax=Oceanospirillum multiglobuliferum TaxID=64969 RepID=A0A1V4T243_9GAMM|nr:hypothetical protein BTE48_16410 [Oceanospirillum multiglobuliferum]
MGFLAPLLGCLAIPSFYTLHKDILWYRERLIWGEGAKESLDQKQCLKIVECEDIGSYIGNFHCAALVLRK